MKKLFSMDSKFMRIMGRVGDLMILNVLFILTSLPIITVGASITAVYTVCFRMGTDRETGTISSYLAAFKDNFKQATLLWLFFLICLGTAAGNAMFFWVMPNILHYGAFLFIIIFVLAFFMFTYAFPLLSQFDNKNMGTLKNSLILSMGYLPRTLIMAALNFLPLALLMVNLFAFLVCSFLWFMIYFGLVAYLNTKILAKVFAPYMTEEETIQEDSI